ncbi:MAG: hypothetical protein Q4C09_02705 [Atopobiaceae bacterium]|nr:hypothetical protein [Atopobiaceae bacterium]
MSFQLPTITRADNSQPRWSGMAVLVESMLVLLIMLVSLAIVVLLSSSAVVRARDGRHLAEAISLATSTAERFEANPSAPNQDVNIDEYMVKCTVTPESTGVGTLYHAEILVYVTDGTADPSTPVYTLQTASYERGVK